MTLAEAINDLGLSFALFTDSSLFGYATCFGLVGMGAIAAMILSSILIMIAVGTVHQVDLTRVLENFWPVIATVFIPSFVFGIVCGVHAHIYRDSIITGIVFNGIILCCILINFVGMILVTVKIVSFGQRATESVAPIKLLVKRLISMTQ